MSYNGWTNKETWLISLHFGPQSAQELEVIRENLEDEYSKLPMIFQDMISLEKIDWEQLTEAE